MPQLLASAPSLKGINQSVRQFYCRSVTSPDPVTTPDDGTTYVVSRSDGTPIPGVRVIRKRGRYRFELTD